MVAEWRAGMQRNCQIFTRNSQAQSGLLGRLYAAHSNYPEWPMTNTIEVWNTATCT